MIPKRVAIIGAGPSGLPCIRHALLYGFEPICFESTDKIGGLWNYREEGNSILQNTVINTSKELNAYSDFPPKKEYANYMHHSKMLEYLLSYSTHYGLDKYIRLNHKVISVQRSDTFEDDGKWCIKYEFGGEQFDEIFDGVLLCIGHHKIPNYPPKWCGQNQFRGIITHSNNFKTTKGFENKRVLCVGVGNSGLDIAVELSKVAKQVFLSSRRGVWIFNRYSNEGIPADVQLETRFCRLFLSLLPKWLRQRFIFHLIDHRFNPNVYGLKPDFDLFSAHKSVNDELAFRIGNGTVQITGDILDFHEQGVRFKSGQIEEIDEVVLSTGYSIDFPLLEQGQLITVEDNWVKLYKNMFVPHLNHQTLAIIGLIQVTGSIMPNSEMQSRLFFAQLSGECRLPERSDMERDIEMREKKLRETYVASPRHTIQVDYTGYSDDLAELIGCRPNYRSLLLCDPFLAYTSYTSPNAAYNYRLMGPHSWKDARQAILGIQYRTQMGCVQDWKIGKLLIQILFSIIGTIVFVMSLL